MKDIVERLRDAADAYPEDIFPAPSRLQLEMHPEVITRASASMGRHFSPMLTAAADEIDILRGLLRECMAADWRTNDNTLWPRLVAATRE